MKIKLSNGMIYGLGPNGERICAGARMGRRNILPHDLPPQDARKEYKLHLQRMPLDSGGYDSGGAYWGHGQPMWIATEGAKTESGITIFMRAPNREAAKRSCAEIVKAEAGATVNFYR